MRSGGQKRGYDHDSRRRLALCSPPGGMRTPGCSLRRFEQASGHQQPGGWGRESVSCLPSPLNIQYLKCSDRAGVSAGT